MDKLPRLPAGRDSFLRDWPDNVRGNMVICLDVPAECAGELKALLDNAAQRALENYESSTEGHHHWMRVAHVLKNAAETIYVRTD